MDSNVENFANLDIRVGQIISVEVFEEAGCILGDYSSDPSQLPTVRLPTHVDMLPNKL